MRHITKVQGTKIVTTGNRLLHYEYIKETLAIYKPEYIYLNSAKWTGSELAGYFNLEHYPFTKKEHIGYVTASMLMLYLSQLGYIYIRVLCEEKLLPIDIQNFFRLRDRGNIVFVDFNKIKFSRKIVISESPLEIKMRQGRILAIKGNIIGNIFFEVGGGTFTGETRVAIMLNEEQSSDET
jgi:hypothetical protein